MQHIVIVPNHLVDIIKQGITKYKPIQFGYDFISFNQWIEHQCVIQFSSSYHNQIQVYHQLQHLSKKNRFYSLINQKEFIDQVYKFMYELKKYQVNFSHIEDVDIKELISIVSKVNLNIDILYEKLEQLDFSKIQVLEGNYALHEEEIFKKYQVRKISLNELCTNLNIPYFTKAKQEKVIQCLNIIQEVEFIASKIVNENLDLDEIAIQYSHASYIPIIQQVFSRYHIPYQNKGESTSLFLNQILEKAFSYYYDKSLFNELLLDYNLFQIEKEKLELLKKYYSYFKTFDDLNHLSRIDFSLLSSEEEWKKNPTEDKIIEFLFTKEDLIRMQQLEVEVAKIYEGIQMIKNKLDQCDIKEYCVMVYNFAAKLASNKEEIALMNQVRNLLQELSNDIHIEYVFKSIILWIKDLRVNTTNQNGVVVTSLKNNIPFKKIGFILGCDSKNYNQFKLIDGIFNETMNPIWQDLVGYPSAKERYFHYLAHIENLEYDKIYYTYSTINLDGKANELDSHFSLMAQEKFVQYYESYSYNRKFELSEEIARSLYLQNNIIDTSVTKLQCFNQSPFLFYLKYGLRIKEKFQEGYNAAFKGSLYHHLLEKYINKYGKNYAQYGEREFDKNLQAYFDFYRKILLKQYDDVYAIDEYDMRNTLKVSLEQLQEVEELDEFNPKLVEQEYEYLLEEESYQIRIKGKIDRIDECPTFGYNLLKVIDYKSSSKDFMKNRFIRGIDIQLPTYLLVTNRLLFKTSVMLGAFYYILSARKSDLRVTGLNFSSIKNSDLSTFESKFNVQTKTPKDLDFATLLQQCEYIYRESIDKILSGDIRKELDIDYQYYPYPYLFGKQENTLNQKYVEWGE